MTELGWGGLNPGALYYDRHFSLNVLCKLVPSVFILQTGSEANHAPFFQILFFRVCSDYCSAGQSSVTETNQDRARQHGWERTNHSNFGQQPWKHVILHRVGRVCGLGNLVPGPGTTDNKQHIGVAHFTEKRQFIEQGAPEMLSTERKEEMKWRKTHTDMATFAVLLWTLAFSGLPYTSKGPASWKYHEVAHLVPESQE